MAEALFEANGALLPSYEWSGPTIPDEGLHCLHCGEPGHMVQHCHQPTILSNGTDDGAVIPFGTGEMEHNPSQLATAVVISHRALSAAKMLSPLPFDAGGVMNCRSQVCTHHRLSDLLKALEYVVEWQGRKHFSPCAIDLDTEWIADFSKCPAYWTFVALGDQNRIFFVFKPMGLVEIHAFAASDWLVDPDILEGGN